MNICFYIRLSRSFQRHSILSLRKKIFVCNPMGKSTEKSRRIVWNSKHCSRSWKSFGIHSIVMVNRKCKGPFVEELLCYSNICDNGNARKLQKANVFMICTSASSFRRAAKLAVYLNICQCIQNNTPQWATILIFSAPSKWSMEIMTSSLASSNIYKIFY